jgi:nucleoside-diphosphate-sugar epimerase
MVKMPAELVHRLQPLVWGRPFCVTGGAGFIGGHIVDTLVSLGASVSVIDDLSNSTAEHLVDLIELEPQRVRFVHGSILDDAALAEAMAGAKVVLHLAAVGSVPLSIANPERSWTVNATGTMRVLQAARVAGVERVVYSASSSAYGDAPCQTPGETAAPRRESEAPAPLSPYAASKLAGEHAMRGWSKSYGLSTISLRYFNIFGPRQPADSAYAAVIASFARRLVTGESPIIFGDGTQSRDFTPVASVVAANLLAATSAKDLAGQVVNIGTGVRTDLLTLARVMAERAGNPGNLPLPTPVFRPARQGEVMHSQADVSAARKLLDYHPVGTLDEAIGETIAWYRQQVVGGGR